MKKKFLSTVLSLAIVLGTVLTGCGNANDASSTATGEKIESAGSAESGDASGSGEITDITMAYMIFNTSAPDMALVEEEINKISEKEIGVHVNIEPINVGDYVTQVNLMFSSGEPLDIVHAFSNNFISWYANGSLLPIDEELKQYGQGIVDALGENMLKAGQINGQQYGITTNRDLACTYGFGFRTDLLEKYNIKAEEIKTLEDVEAALAVIKENEPGIIPLTSNTQAAMLFNTYKYGVDPLGDSLGVLVDMEDENLKVENLFESDRYTEFVRTMRDWYEKGYIQSDMATSSEVGATLMRSGGAFAEPITGKPGLVTQLATETGYPMTVVELTDADTSTSMVQVLQYAVAQNSEHPDKAVQFLNLLYTNAEVANLLSWGIEGKHYVKTDDGHITFPEGVDASNSGYNLVQGWLVGNQFLTYVWEGDDLEVWKQMDAFNKSATVSKAMGFSFDSSNVKTEYAACSAVVQQYRTALECGSLDPDTALKDFNDALYAAGLQKIIDEKQAQLNEWAGK